MMPFNHRRTAIIWGFGTINKRDNHIVAWGPFCYVLETGERLECGHTNGDDEDYFGCYVREAH